MWQRIKPLIFIFYYHIFVNHRIVAEFDFLYFRLVGAWIG